MMFIVIFSARSIASNLSTIWPWNSNLPSGEEGSGENEILEEEFVVKNLPDTNIFRQNLLDDETEYNLVEQGFMEITDPKSGEFIIRLSYSPPHMCRFTIG